MFALPCVRDATCLTLVAHGSRPDQGPITRSRRDIHTVDVISRYPSTRLNHLLIQVLFIISYIVAKDKTTLFVMLGRDGSKN
jgi:hypothetical protein